jgi:hypothetical protein
MLVGSDLCRVCLAGCRHTPGLLSSLRETAGLPPSITFSTSYTEMGAKCGGRGNKIDVRPNWKEQPERESLTGKQWR